MNERPTARKLLRLFPHASRSCLEANAEVPDPGPEPDHAPALGSPAEGKEERVGRVTVRFVGYRVRPLDPDGFAASVKGILDGLRHASLLAGDEWWRIKLETEQVKVAHFSEEKTEIELIYPGV